MNKKELEAFAREAAKGLKCEMPHAGWPNGCGPAGERSQYNRL